MDTLYFDADGERTDWAVDGPGYVVMLDECRLTLREWVRVWVLGGADPRANVFPVNVGPLRDEPDPDAQRFTVAFTA